MEAEDEKRSAMLDLVRRWRESGTTAKVFCPQASDHAVDVVVLAESTAA